jgi:hypothetical protein
MINNEKVDKKNPPLRRLEKTMKIYTPQEMVSAQQKYNDGENAAVRSIVLEAPTLLELSKSATDWMNAHPHYQLLTFSHALETRLEPVAGLVGPRPYSAYTGVLLVGSPSHAEVQEQSELPFSRW